MLNPLSFHNGSVFRSWQNGLSWLAVHGWATPALFKLRWDRAPSLYGIHRRADQENNQHAMAVYIMQNLSHGKIYWQTTLEMPK